MARLFAVLVVCYAVLFVVYLLVKIGVVKCVAKNAIKMVWKPCWACCHALSGACGLLCGKLRDTKRVYRGRRRDVELGEVSASTYDMGSSSSSDDDDGDHHRGGVAASSSRSRRKSSSSSVGERRKEMIRQSLRLKRTNSKVEHVARVSHGSGRRHRHSTGQKGTEVPPSMLSLRVHGSPPARGHSHVHRRSIRRLSDTAIGRQLGTTTIC